ncbi:CMD domain-containing protein [Microbacterium album]|uniref:CMD domain protein n=1 Tax=Microbacterium album TaxID=2053191 RepID=A0A917MKG7_9MICO|nr:hypothetical protein [Microbacterium album]GGH34562.1 CMD domain protein [Microbacterium album]
MMDVIERIAEAGDDSPRDHRPVVREAAQASYHALFDVPADDPVPGLDRPTRHLLAARAAWLDGDASAAEFYLEGVADADVHKDLVVAGPDGAQGVRAPRRIRAALRFVDLLITRPAAATADDLAGLEGAGWSPAEIVVIGQITGFVSYQTRVAHGLRVLADAQGGHA